MRVDLPGCVSPAGSADESAIYSRISRAALYSICGKLLWRSQAIGEPLCRPEPAAVVRMFSEFARRGEQKWSDQIHLSGEQHDVLLGLWRQRAVNQEVPAPRLAASQNTLRLVTDASGSMQRVGIVRYTECRAGGRLQSEGSEDAVGRSIFWKQLDQSIVQILSTAVQEKGVDDVNIHLLELAGIVQAIIEVRKGELGGEKQVQSLLIILGTDSMTAKAWCERLYARNQYANKLLCVLLDALGHTQLHLAYIPSDYNVADAPSRNAEIRPSRLRDDSSASEEDRKLATATYESLLILRKEEVIGLLRRGHRAAARVTASKVDTTVKQEGSRRARTGEGDRDE